MSYFSAIMSHVIVNMKSTVKYGLWISLAALLIGGAYAYWQHLTYHPSTDDAYVRVNIVNISPNVGGHVENLYVHDNQVIKKGTLLYTIDSRPYEISLNHALANLDLTKQQILAAKDTVFIASAKVSQAETQYELDKKYAARINILVKEGKASLASGDDTNAKLALSHSAVLAAKRSYQQAITNLGEDGEQNANLRAARATVKKAKLDLLYTKIKAPIDGKISQLSLREGDIVRQGQTSFTVIEQKDYWVEANFKETQLTRIRVGQPATITLDMFPRQPMQGIVESISGSTGSSFSILPPENASGNWVKVTQRIPVRITLNATSAPLALGASASVSINTGLLTADKHA